MCDACCTVEQKIGPRFDEEALLLPGLDQSRDRRGVLRRQVVNSTDRHHHLRRGSARTGHKQRACQRPAVAASLALRLDACNPPAQSQSRWRPLAPPPRGRCPSRAARARPCRRRASDEDDRPEPSMCSSSLHAHTRAFVAAAALPCNVHPARCIVCEQSEAPAGVLPAKFSTSEFERIRWRWGEDTGWRLH